MLIVCPTCATSYMIDPASLGPSGRTVRCVRCKATWFAGGQTAEPKLSAFVDGVIAEAEAKSPPTPQGAIAPSADNAGGKAPQKPAAAPRMPAATSFPAPQPHEVQRQNDDFGPPIEDAPSLVPPIEHAHEAPAADQDDSETFAARRQRLKSRLKEKRRSSRWTALLLVLLAFNVALLGARHEIVRYLPQTASLFAAIGLPVNLRHLKFDNVRISKESQNGVSMLIVEGSIVSTGNRPVEVPRLRFAARDVNGQEIYTWTMRPSRNMLGPGERMEFRSRLAAPPKQAHDVMVRFFTATDADAKAAN
jgi:predicted Zn finger-like uncharacterized protein